MLDDDTLLSVPDVSFAFSVWKVTNRNGGRMYVHAACGEQSFEMCALFSALQQFSEQIVGFVPRKHVITSGGVYSYGSFELQDPESAGGDR